MVAYNLVYQVGKEFSVVAEVWCRRSQSIPEQTFEFHTWCKAPCGKAILDLVTRRNISLRALQGAALAGNGVRRPFGWVPHTMDATTQSSILHVDADLRYAPNSWILIVSRSNAGDGTVKFDMF